MSRNVVIFGSVGVNQGDDLMNRVLCNFYSNQGWQVCSASMLPARSESIYKTTYFGSGIRQFGQWLKRIWIADLVVIGGGTVVQDDFGKKFGGILAYVMLVTLTAHVLGKPVIALGVGFNRLSLRRSRYLAKLVKYWDVVVVRDESSKALALEDFGILPSKLMLAPDLAFNVSHYDVFEEHQQVVSRLQQTNYVVIALAGEVHKDAGAHILTDLLSYCRRKQMRVIGIAMDSRPTEELEVYGQVESTTREIFEILIPATPYEVIEVLRRAKAVVSMRLHSSILSLISKNKPIVISRETKTAWLATWIGKERFIELGDYSADKLERALEWSIDQYGNAALDQELKTYEILIEQALISATEKVERSR